MIRTTNVAEALECLYLKKKAVVIVADEKMKYDSEMYILTENNQELSIQLDIGSVEPLLFN